MDGAAFLGIFKQADSSSEKKKASKQMTKIKPKKKQKKSPIKPENTPLKLIKPEDKLTPDKKIMDAKEDLNSIQSLHSTGSNGFEDSLSSNSAGLSDSIKVKFSWSVCKSKQNHDDYEDLNDEEEDLDDDDDLNETMEFYEELDKHKDDYDKTVTTTTTTNNKNDDANAKKNIIDKEINNDDEEDFVQPQKKVKLLNALGSHNGVKIKRKYIKSNKNKTKNNDNESLTRLFKNINNSSITNNNNNTNNNTINNNKNDGTNNTNNNNNINNEYITITNNTTQPHGDKPMDVSSNDEDDNNDENNDKNNNNMNNDNNKNSDYLEKNKIPTNDKVETNDDNSNDKMMVGKRKRCAIESDEDDKATTDANNDNGLENDNTNNGTGNDENNNDDGGGNSVLRRSSRRSSRIMNYRRLLTGDDDDDFVGLKSGLTNSDRKLNKKNRLSKDNKRNNNNEKNLTKIKDDDDVMVVEDKVPKKVASLFNQKSKIKEKVMSQEEIDALERKRKFLFSGSTFKVKKDSPVPVKNDHRTSTYLAPLPIFNHTTQLVTPSSSSSSSSSSPPLKPPHHSPPILPPPCQLLNVAVHNLKNHVVVQPIIESVIILNSPPSPSSQPTSSQKSLQLSPTSSQTSSSQPTSSQTSSSQPTSSQPSSSQSCSNKPKLRESLEASTIDAILNEIHLQNPSFNVKNMYNSLENKRGIFNQNYLKISEPILWTEKYSPTSWQDFVGNRSNFKKVYDWLNECKSKLPSCADNDLWDNIDRKTYDDSSSSRDSFFYRGVSDRRRNNDNVSVEGHVLMLEGPNGVGKTSLVHVLAVSLGFKVIEVNSSSLRDGRHLMSQLQEATQSHQISRGARVGAGGGGGSIFSNCSSGSGASIFSNCSDSGSGKGVNGINTVDSNNVNSGSNGVSNDGNESIDVVDDDAMSEDNKDDDEVVSVVSDDDTMSEEEEEDDDEWNKKSKVDKKSSFMGMFKQVKAATKNKKFEKTPKNKIVIEKTSTKTKGKRGRKKKDTKIINKKEPKTVKKDSSKPPKPSLILFDEADIAFDTDKGFYSTIQRLINISKRPIIITCNHPINNRLHANMSRVHLSRPSLVDLSCYLRLLSLLEGYVISNSSLQQLIDFNSCDVRKSLLQLQLSIETLQGSSLLGKRLMNRCQELAGGEEGVEEELVGGEVGVKKDASIELDVTLTDDSDRKLENNRSFKETKIYSFFGDKNENKIKDEEEDDDDDFVDSRITRSRKTAVIYDDDDDDDGDEDNDDDNNSPSNHYQDDNIVYITGDDLNNNNNNNNEQLLVEEYKVDNDDDDKWCLDLFTNNIKPVFKGNDKDHERTSSYFRSPFLKRFNRLSVFDGFCYDVNFAYKKYNNQNNNKRDSSNNQHDIEIQNNGGRTDANDTKQITKNNSNPGDKRQYNDIISVAKITDSDKTPRDSSKTLTTSQHHTDTNILMIMYRSYDNLSLLDSSLPLHPPPFNDHIDKRYDYYHYVLPGCSDATCKSDKYKNNFSGDNNIHNSGINNISNRNNINNNKSNNNNTNNINNNESHLKKEMFNVWYDSIISRTTRAFDRLSRLYNNNNDSENNKLMINYDDDNNNKYTNINNNENNNDVNNKNNNDENYDVIGPLHHAVWSHDRLYGRLANQIQVSEILRRHWMLMDKNSMHLYYMTVLRCICRLEKMRKKKKRRFLHYLRHHLPPTLPPSTFKTYL